MRSGGFYIRAHVGSRVPKILSPKRVVWALKNGPQDWKNESYHNYSPNFDEPAHPFGVQDPGAPLIYGYNRVLGQLSQRNGDKRKY